MNLEKYICDLLNSHECVIVPEFGGFISNFESASIQPATHTIIPPRKFLVFNSSLKINDGLLASEISTRMKCSFDEAMHFIRKEVTAWHERLKAGKLIILPGIGSFRTNKDGKLEFMPDEEQNFFDEAFGLNSLVIQPLPKRTRRLRPQTIHYHKPMRRFSSRSIRRLAWAAAITIPLAVAGIWSIMNYDTLRQYTIQHSGFININKSEPIPLSNKTIGIESDSFTTDVLPKPDLPQTAEEETMQIDGITDSPVQNAPVSENDELAESISATTNEAPHKPSSINIRAYHIIIGSFESNSNAEQLVEELNSSGMNSRMIESSQGMYRVSMASYIDKQEALQQLYKIREESNPNAWLLRI